VTPSPFWYPQTYAPPGIERDFSQPPLPSKPNTISPPHSLLPTPPLSPLPLHALGSTLRVCIFLSNPKFSLFPSYPSFSPKHSPPPKSRLSSWPPLLLFSPQPKFTRRALFFWNEKFVPGNRTSSRPPPFRRPRAPFKLPQVVRSKLSNPSLLYAPFFPRSPPFWPRVSCDSPSPPGGSLNILCPSPDPPPVVISTFPEVGPLGDGDTPVRHHLQTRCEFPGPFFSPLRYFIGSPTTLFYSSL